MGGNGGGGGFGGRVRRNRKRGGERARGGRGGMGGITGGGFVASAQGTRAEIRQRENSLASGGAVGRVKARQKLASKYIAQEMKAGYPRAQAVAIGLRRAGVPPKVRAFREKGTVPLPGGNVLRLIPAAKPALPPQAPKSIRTPEKFFEKRITTVEQAKAAQRRQVEALQAELKARQEAAQRLVNLAVKAHQEAPARVAALRKMAEVQLKGRALVSPAQPGFTFKVPRWKQLSSRKAIGQRLRESGLEQITEKTHKQELGEALADIVAGETAAVRLMDISNIAMGKMMKNPYGVAKYELGRLLSIRKGGPTPSQAAGGRIYRILTEDINRPKVEQIVGKKYPGFTVVPSTGYWKGQREKSIAIELVGAKKRDVVNIAQQIKKANKQQAMLVEGVAATTQFLRKGGRVKSMALGGVPKQMVLPFRDLSNRRLARQQTIEFLKQAQGTPGYRSLQLKGLQFRAKVGNEIGYLNKADWLAAKRAMPAAPKPAQLRVPTVGAVPREGITVPSRSQLAPRQIQYVEMKTPVGKALVGGRFLAGAYLKNRRAGLVYSPQMRLAFTGRPLKVPKGKIRQPRIPRLPESPALDAILKGQGSFDQRLAAFKQQAQKELFARAKQPKPYTPTVRASDLREIERVIAGQEARGTLRSGKDVANQILQARMAKQYLRQLQQGARQQARQQGILARGAAQQNLRKLQETVKAQGVTRMGALGTPKAAKLTAKGFTQSLSQGGLPIGIRTIHTGDNRPTLLSRLTSPGSTRAVTWRNRMVVQYGRRVKLTNPTLSQYARLEANPTAAITRMVNRKTGIPKGLPKTMPEHFRVMTVAGQAFSVPTRQAGRILKASRTYAIGSYMAGGVPRQPKMNPRRVPARIEYMMNPYTQDHRTGQAKFTEPGSTRQVTWRNAMVRKYGVGTGEAPYKANAVDKQWARQVTGALRDQGVWGYPAMGLVYKINQRNRSLKLQNPERLKNPQVMLNHNRTEQVFGGVGYKVTPAHTPMTVAGNYYAVPVRNAARILSASKTLPVGSYMAGGPAAKRAFYMQHPATMDHRPAGAIEPGSARQVSWRNMMVQKQVAAGRAIPIEKAYESSKTMGIWPNVNRRTGRIRFAHGARWAPFATDNNLIGKGPETTYQRSMRLPQGPLERASVIGTKSGMRIMEVGGRGYLIRAGRADRILKASKTWALGSYAAGGKLAKGAIRGISTAAGAHLGYDIASTMTGLYGGVSRRNFLMAAGAGVATGALAGYGVSRLATRGNGRPANSFAQGGAIKGIEANRAKRAGFGFLSGAVGPFAYFPMRWAGATKGQSIRASVGGLFGPPGAAIGASFAKGGKTRDRNGVTVLLHPNETLLSRRAAGVIAAAKMTGAGVAAAAIGYGTARLMGGRNGAKQIGALTGLAGLMYGGWKANQPGGTMALIPSKAGRKVTNLPVGRGLLARTPIPTKNPYGQLYRVEGGEYVANAKVTRRLNKLTGGRFNPDAAASRRIPAIEILANGERRVSFAKGGRITGVNWGRRLGRTALAIGGGMVGSAAGAQIGALVGGYRGAMAGKLLGGGAGFTLGAMQLRPKTSEGIRSNWFRRGYIGSSYGGQIAGAAGVIAGGPLGLLAATPVGMLAGGVAGILRRPKRLYQALGPQETGESSYAQGGTVRNPARYARIAASRTFGVAANVAQHVGMAAGLVGGTLAGGYAGMKLAQRYKWRGNGAYMSLLTGALAGGGLGAQYGGALAAAPFNSAYRRVMPSMRSGGVVLKGKSPQARVNRATVAGAAAGFLIPDGFTPGGELLGAAIGHRIGERVVGKRVPFIGRQAVAAAGRAIKRVAKANAGRLGAAVAYGGLALAAGSLTDGAFGRGARWSRPSLRRMLNREALLWSGIAAGMGAATYRRGAGRANYTPMLTTLGYALGRGVGDLGVDRIAGLSPNMPNWSPWYVRNGAFHVGYSLPLITGLNRLLNSRLNRGRTGAAIRGAVMGTGLSAISSGAFFPGQALGWNRKGKVDAALIAGGAVAAAAAYKKNGRGARNLDFVSRNVFGGPSMLRALGRGAGMGVATEAVYTASNAPSFLGWRERAIARNIGRARFRFVWPTTQQGYALGVGVGGAALGGAVAASIAGRKDKTRIRVRGRFQQGGVRVGVRGETGKGVRVAVRGSLARGGRVPWQRRLASRAAFIGAYGAMGALGATAMVRNRGLSPRLAAGLIGAGAAAGMGTGILARKRLLKVGPLAFGASVTGTVIGGMAGRQLGADNSYRAAAYGLMGAVAGHEMGRIAAQTGFRFRTIIPEKRFAALRVGPTVVGATVREEPEGRDVAKAGLLTRIKSAGGRTLARVIAVKKAVVGPRKIKTATAIKVKSPTPLGIHGIKTQARADITRRDIKGVIEPSEIFRQGGSVIVGGQRLYGRIRRNRRRA